MTTHLSDHDRELRSDDGTHCARCNRPLPHNEAEQRACPSTDLLGSETPASTVGLDEVASQELAQARNDAVTAVAEAERLRAELAAVMVARDNAEAAIARVEAKCAELEAGSPLAEPGAQLVANAFAAEFRAAVGASSVGSVSGGTDPTEEHTTRTQR